MDTNEILDKMRADITEIKFMLDNTDEPKAKAIMFKAYRVSTVSLKLCEAASRGESEVVGFIHFEDVRELLELKITLKAVDGESTRFGRVFKMTIPEDAVA